MQSLEAVRGFFNRRASTWDESIDAETLGKSIKIAESLDIKPGGRVLDVGCGTGILLPRLLEAVGDEGFVWALDIAEEMLREARRKYRRPNLNFLRCDIAGTPFPERLFDLVVCHNCFPHFVDKEGAVLEMFRILAPAGRVVISHTESREAVNERHRRMGGVVGGDVLPGEDAMRRLLQKAGFRDVHIRDDGDGYLVRAARPALSPSMDGKEAVCAPL
jgi:ubiquinone/menaquinone biosynthesis C-methylase UbiE